jgi:hypothetical protein
VLPRGQFSRSLRLHFPDQPEMCVAHETIYQALCVQAQGGLGRELTKGPAHRPNPPGAATPSRPGSAAHFDECAVPFG